jgi:hypothetical protein
MLFSTSVPRDPEIDAWMRDHPDDLGAIAKHWFSVIRNCGADVHELLHDGHPTACVGDAAIAYVNAFKAHVKLLLRHRTRGPCWPVEGTGKFMRHVKLKPESPVNESALEQLIEAAYKDTKAHLAERGASAV